MGLVVKAVSASDSNMTLMGDLLPEVTLGITSGRISETGGVATVTASLSAVSDLPVTVNLVLSGTALPVKDYTCSETNLTITAGSLSGSITLAAVQDTLYEADETVITSIGIVSNATTGEVTVVTVTIGDDDPSPMVSLSLTGSPLKEQAGVATVTATLSATSGLPVTVNLAFSGTASWPGDYSPSSTFMTINAGKTSGTIKLTAVQDMIDEENETIIVAISTVENGIAGDVPQVTESITDDDPPPKVFLYVPGALWMSEAYGSVTVMATNSAVSGLPVTVDLVFSGSALKPDDYACTGGSITIPAGSLSGVVMLTAVQDSALEGGEKVMVDIGSVFNGTESGVQQVAVTIVDDDQHWVGSGDRVVAWTNSASACRLRLGVRHEGAYQVTAGEIALASGVSSTGVLEALASGGLALSCQGREIAWTTDGQALYFFGVPSAELFAPENVYWLAFGQGMSMEVFDATPGPAGATNQWYMHAESCRASFLAPYDPRDRRSGAGTLTNVLNFGEWIPALPTESTRTKTQTVSLPGFSASAATGVVARVSLASYHDFTAPDNQTCEVFLNGTNCGARSWSGEQALVFDYPVPPGVVTSEVAQLKIRNGLTSLVSDFMLLDATLIYPRLYRAAEGALLCTGGDAQTVAVDGFATPQLRVWDITVPATPLELVAPVGPATNGTWEVAFACGDAGTRYAVFDTSAGCFHPSVSGVRDTDWSDPAEMPELAIVIPPRRWVSGFDEAVQPLANFRTAQGLRTRIIDAEEIYNAFSDGLVHPKAFQMFSAAGVTNGATQTLRYLLFAGHGGSDYKLEVFRLGQDEPYPTLFPLYLFPQVEASSPAALMLPNDPVLGNAVGGAVPEVAVGRFIATHALELALMVNKTIRYELTETWKNKALFVACKQYYPSDPNFSNSVARTAAGFPSGGWAVSGFYPQAPYFSMDVLWDYDYDNTGVRYELAKGAGFLYYYGHSSDTLLGVSRSSGQWFIQSKTLMTNDTWSFAPVAMLMGCRIGRWTMLDLKNREQCIAEAGVRNPIAGFSAVISAAGYLQPEEAEDFANGFRDCIAAGALRLGDAWCGAFASMGDNAAAKAQHMTLLGDPSLCIRTGVTARGTPSAWLIAQGLTNDPYADLKDQDADGFVTWQEYQAGTDYLLNSGLRILALSVPGALATGMPLAFEALATKGHRVLSTTNLTSGVWEPLPWRVDASAPWSSSAIPGDWPKKAVEVPYSREEPQRFYRIEAE